MVLLRLFMVSRSEHNFQITRKHFSRIPINYPLADRCLGYSEWTLLNIAWGKRCMVRSKWTTFNICREQGQGQGGPHVDSGAWTCPHVICGWPIAAWVVVIWGPPMNRLTERHDWKHYLPTTPFCCDIRPIPLAGQFVQIGKTQIFSI